MKSKHLAILIASVGLMACATGPDPILGPVTTVDTTPPGKDTGKDKKAPPSMTAPPDDNPNAGECSGEATQTACFECCGTNHVDGEEIFYFALLDCLCEASSC